MGLHPGPDCSKSNTSLLFTFIFSFYFLTFPVLIQLLPCEQSSVLELIKTDNKVNEYRSWSLIFFVVVVCVLMVTVNFVLCAGFE